MERIVYKSKSGRVIFGFDSPYVLSATEGFCGGEVSRNLLEFMDTDGAAVDSSFYEPRIVTVKGFIRAPNSLETASLRKRLTNLLNCKEEGVLEYICDTGRYQSAATPEALPTFGTQLQNILPFVIYFMLPAFYWQGLPICQHDILKTDPNLIFPFTFPDYFGLVTTRGNVMNNGAVPAPCVIRIWGSSASINTFSLSQGLEVINHTTKTHLLINYDITSDEVITIDTEKPSIVSNISGNILNRIDFGESGEYSDYTTDVAMKLLPGVNDIECINYNPSHMIRAAVSFYQLYLGV